MKAVTPFIRKEAAGLLLGKKIGRGMGRAVYICRLDPRFVVKVESAGNAFQNVVEWETWKMVEGESEARWFAPCCAISGAGSVLVQRRTSPASDTEYPKRMPIFLGDYKRENFGMLDGRLVCHDYGLLSNISNGLRSGATRAVDWQR